MMWMVGSKEERKYFRNILEEKYFIFTCGWCGWWEAKKRRKGEDADVEVRMKFTFHKSHSDFVTFLFQKNNSCFFCDKSNKFSGWFYLLHIFFVPPLLLYTSQSDWEGGLAASQPFRSLTIFLASSSNNEHFQPFPSILNSDNNIVQPCPTISNPTNNHV